MGLPSAFNPVPTTSSRHPILGPATWPSRYAVPVSFPLARSTSNRNRSSCSITGPEPATVPEVYREAGIDFGTGPLGEADACVRTVFALDPTSAPGFQLRGWVHYGHGRIQEAVGDLKAALAIDGSNADSLLLLANCYLISGCVPASRDVIARLLAVDPLTPVSRCMPAFADLLEGRLAAALEPYRAAVEMDPGNPMARLFYAWVLALNGRTDALDDVVARFPDETRDTVPARIAFFLADAAAGRRRAATAQLTGELEAAATAPDLFARMLAHGHALAGASDEAMHWLSIAVERGFINYPFLAEHDPVFAGLRTLPEFQRLLGSVRARWNRFTP